MPDCKNVREDLVWGSHAEGRDPWIYVFHDYLPSEHLFGGFIRQSYTDQFVLNFNTKFR